MKVDTKLSTYEICALTIIFISLKLSDTTPTLLAQTTQNAFWYVPLLSIIVISPFLFILYYLLAKYKARNLVDLFEILLGKFLGKTLAFFIFLYSYFLAAFDFRGYVNQIKLLYFEKSSINIIFVLLIFICIFGGIRGIKVIGYTAKVFFPFLELVLLLLVALTLPSIVVERIYPIFGSGLSHVLTESVSRTSLFASTILLMMIPSIAKKPENFYKGTIIGLIISAIQIVFLFFIYTTFIDYKSISKTPFPFHEIALYVDLGSFFTNVETFFMTFWLLATFIRFTLFLYLITWLFGAIFNIEKFELLLLPMGFLIMVIGLIPDNMIITELVYRNQLLSIASTTTFVFPLILLVGHFFKRGKGRSS
ncbi:GerAB/ArcD/ProY family transporter [Amphibacillus sp. Q70]|uniref:GerAB/ArcD/ProY family transporter n=1 Tax=Amphibacillus sp. Q70 TaxID=3453416 RepID=UPI003F82C16E